MTPRVGSHTRPVSTATARGASSSEAARRTGGIRGHACPPPKEPPDPDDPPQKGSHPSLFRLLFWMSSWTPFLSIWEPTWPQLTSQLGPKAWTDGNGKQFLDFIFCGMLETVCNCFLFCFAFLFLLVAGWLLLAAAGCCYCC